MTKNVCNTAFLYSLAITYAQLAITDNSQTPALYIIIKTKVSNDLLEVRSVLTERLKKVLIYIAAAVYRLTQNFSINLNFTNINDLLT